MSRTAVKRVVPIGLAATLAVGSLMLNGTQANAAYEYTAIPQSQLQLVEVDSVETSGEGANGAGALALDGNPDTYWHTQWLGTVVQPPHHITVKLADTAVQLGRVRLLPRQSSNGSGRVHEYELWTANGDCTTATYTKRAEGSFPGDLATKAEERAITLDAPVAATCAKVVYLSSWGGASSTSDTSPTEVVASLAEFNADTAVWVEPTGTPTTTPTTSPTTTPTGPVIDIPAGAVELVDGDLKVRLHPAFPQVVDYRLGDRQLPGRLGAPLTSVLINEVAQNVTVAAPTKATDGKSATYKLTFPGLSGVSMDAVASVANGAFKLTFTNLVDPTNQVSRLRIPNHDLVTVTSADATSQLTASLIGVNRGTSGDRFEPLASTAAGTVQGSWLVIANNSTLAAAFDTNATEDNTGPASTSSRVSTQNNRMQRQIATVGTEKRGTVWSGTWTWLGTAAKNVAGATLGRDKDPYVEVKLTADANADSVVDWQDGAIAARSIIELGLGADKVGNEVISRIPFNIVSQTTHPFLRTLDDTKRISLATDNLGQKVLLKGYQSEGHDAAHPDYADHYNEKAGGLTDLKTLVNEGANWNSTFGVHVNATESYSEAKAFSEELLRMPPQAAWGWMNQSYYIDGPKDLATREVLKRFQQFRDEVPANLSWLYIDVYWPYGWEMERLASELTDQGWGLASEWSDRFPAQTVWSHWSQEENYGGSTNKGLNSNVLRFIYNSNRDTWNPHPILSNTNLVDFEGWTGHNNYNAFIKNVWERNLPTKFLQQSPIVKWETNKITLGNGTVATSPLTTIGGSVIPTNREITFDGSTVYSQGKYLLPWKDGGTDRLYHWNPEGGASTWKLTNAWSAQSSVTLFKLTDTGRVKVADLKPSAGSVTITAEPGVAYVLYPTSAVPAAKAPNWGQATQIKDPGFFAGNLDAYTTSGNVTIEKSARANFQALIGDGAASLSQTLPLPAGTWSGWAWVEIEPGKQRMVSVEASGTGVTKAGYATGTAGKVTNTISASNAVNATASDEKRDGYFQRVRVTFTSTGSPVTFSVKAAGGSAKVRVDDLRVVKHVAAVDPAPTAQTVFFEDFEHIDTGYFPFVTGSTNRGGDARTQLTERHEPYSQKGWYGINSANTVVAGGKLNDNVLTGHWSLMANNENSGEILKTAPGSIPFKAGHKYKVSFDYQTTYADQYRVRIGKDVPAGTTFTTTNLVNNLLPETRTTTKYTAEFTADSCDPFFVAIDKLAGTNTQHNMTIDNIRVEDLGAAAEVTCLSGSVTTVDPGAVRAGSDIIVQTRISSMETGTVTGVEHDLVLPAGWTKVLVEGGATSLEAGGESVATWRVSVPASATSGTLTLAGKAVVDGAAKTVAGSKVLTVLASDAVFLSDMRDAVVGTPVNGWGPIEWDMSNGEQAQGDGTAPQSVGGVQYPKGIGVHANSTVVFNLAGKCTRFDAIVGIDDVQGDRGSVTFQVLGDNGTVLVPTTAELTGSSPGLAISADVTGVQQITLKVNAGANNGNDHADWAMARVSCGEAQPVDSVDPVVTAPASGTVNAKVNVSVTGYRDSAIAGPASIIVNGVKQGEITIAADGTGSGQVTLPATAGTATVEIRQVLAGITATLEPGSTVTIKVTTATTPPVTTPPVTTPPVTTPPVTTPPVTTPPATTKPPVVTPGYPYKLWTVPGYHDYGGRKWFTKCEPYSQTFRCFTYIWATQVTQVNGKFVQKADWYFNNLTYLPMPRAFWGNHNFARNTHWVEGGRNWYTECGTPRTGSDACRSYLRVSMIASTAKPGGGYTYRWVTDWVFNHQVLFKS